ncbi:MAG: hypothetical protein RH917_05160 [Lacipirellulaceae bacterium]
MRFSQALLSQAQRTKGSTQANGYLGVLLIVVSLGCEQSAPPAAPAPKLTPKQKLEVLVGRLKDLTKDSTSDIGLIVKREISHRFLAPEETSEAPQEASETLPKGEINVVTKRFISFRSGENPLTGEAPENAEIQPILHRSESETKKYELTYLDDRWQLETELTDESEKVWFKYALESAK